MIFAVLFVVSFVIGLACYVGSGRWWLGGVVGSLLLLAISVTGLSSGGPRGMAIYFGIPIIFLGSLFGAYIVQLRRAPELDELDENQSETEAIEPQNTRSDADIADDKGQQSAEPKG